MRYTAERRKALMMMERKSSVDLMDMAGSKVGGAQPTRA